MNIEQAVINLKSRKGPSAGTNNKGRYWHPFEMIKLKKDEFYSLYSLFLGCRHYENGKVTFLVGQIYNNADYNHFNYLQDFGNHTNSCNAIQQLKSKNFLEYQFENNIIKLFNDLGLVGEAPGPDEEPFPVKTLEFTFHGKDKTFFLPLSIPVDRLSKGMDLKSLETLIVCEFRRQLSSRMCYEIYCLLSQHGYLTTKVVPVSDTPQVTMTELR